jgi:hypothetical protein
MKTSPAAGSGKWRCTGIRVRVQTFIPNPNLAFQPPCVRSLLLQTTHSLLACPDHCKEAALTPASRKSQRGG